MIFARVYSQRLQIYTYICPYCQSCYQISNMRAEKVILSFVAVFVGLIAAGIAFYLYQSTKVIPTTQTKPATTATKPQAQPPSDSDILTIDSPQDEQVFNKKLVTIKGTTVKGATITVSTTDSDQVVQP